MKSCLSLGSMAGKTAKLKPSSLFVGYAIIHIRQVSSETPPSKILYAQWQGHLTTIRLGLVLLFTPNEEIMNPESINTRFIFNSREFVFHWVGRVMFSFPSDWLY